MLLLERHVWLMLIDRFIYTYIELIQTSSLFSGNLCPYSSPGMPWIDIPIETPFLESLPRT
jgi:hypothetical protein